MLCCKPKSRLQTSKAKAESLLSGCAIYFCAVALLQELRELHRSAREKHPSTADEILPSKIPHSESSALPVKKMCLNTMSLFSFDVADKKPILISCDKAPAQRAVRTVAMCFALGIKQTIAAPSAEKPRPDVLVVTLVAFLCIPARSPVAFTSGCSPNPPSKDKDTPVPYLEAIRSLRLCYSLQT